MILGNIL